ncbi:hypothetical protein NL676_034568 [Syzygium grande]|nr:hypothetical protein NL676_034568 [Syzygium grande]
MPGLRASAYEYGGVGLTETPFGTACHPQDKADTSPPLAPIKAEAWTQVNRKKGKGQMTIGAAPNQSTHGRLWRLVREKSAPSHSGLQPGHEQEALGAVTSSPGRTNQEILPFTASVLKDAFNSK